MFIACAFLFFSTLDLALADCSNLADDEQGDFLLSAPKAVTIYAWIDNYCGPKPLDEVIQAVVALKKELQSRSQSGKK
jgi:hypothetical protein